MQLIRQTKILGSLAALIAVIFFFLALYPTAEAQFGNDGSYGECAYGQSCPSVDDGGNNGNVVDPEDEDSQGEDDGNQADNGSSGEEGGQEETEDNQGEDESGNSSEIVKNRKEQRQKITDNFGVLGPAVDTTINSAVEIVQKLPETQQALLPYYFWILLIILGLILLFQAWLDKKKISQLKIYLNNLNRQIDERQNFLRLVLHHLNTPLATVKSSLELLSSMGSQEQAAVSILTPAVTSLGVMINDITTKATHQESSSQSDELLLEDAKRSTNRRAKLYYLLPVFIAAVFGFGLTYILYEANAFQPSHRFHFQLAGALMASLIFINALRIFRLSRIQYRILLKSRQIAQQITIKREKLITELSESLGSLVYTLQTAQTKIVNQKYGVIFNNGVIALSAISTKTALSVHRLSPEVSEVSLPALITEIFAKYQTEITKKQIVVTTEYSILKPITTFAEDVRVVLDSILSNSVVYNKENGSIDIKTWQDSNYSHIKISDSGIGMSADELSKLFTPFRQSGDVLHFDKGGVGISLYACKEALVRIGGKIEVNTKADKGTVVDISLPINTR